MIDGKYEYFAFISYCWEDDKMAEDLQKTLEGYKFPTSLRVENPNLPTKIRPVFRDKTDLNGHRLEESLMSALESSRYLIVICSPLATKSDWVNRGIQRFIDLGREKDIIPFIVDGEAYADDPKKECFPLALRSLKGKRAIYGININDNGRDAAAVKVVSRMFDVKYDTLWNRFLLEQKRRRRYTIAGLVATILAVAGVAGYIWMQNQKIQSQYKELQTKNAKIEQQNKDLDEKSDSIANVNTALVAAKDSIQRAYEKLDLSERNLAKSNADLKESNTRLAQEMENVKKANWETQINYAKLVAEKANGMMNEDCYVNARKLLLEVLPDEENDNNKPLVAEAEQAFRRSFESNSQRIEFITPNNEQVRFSKDKKTLAAFSFYKVRLINVGDGSITEAYDSHDIIQDVSFLDDNKKLFLITSKYIRTIDLINHKTEKEVPLKGFYFDHKWYGVLSIENSLKKEDKTVYVYSHLLDRNIYQFKIETSRYVESAILYTQSFDVKVAIAYSDGSIAKYDAETGKCDNEWHASSNRIVEMDYNEYDKRLAVKSCNNINIALNLFGEDIISRRADSLKIWDPTKAQLVMEKDITESKGEVRFSKSGGYIIVNKNNHLQVLSSQNGDLIQESKVLVSSESFDINENDSSVVFVNDKGYIHVWDVSGILSAEQQKQPKKNYTSPNAFSPDGRTCVFSAGNILMTYDYRHNKLIDEVDVTKDSNFGIQSIKFNNDGSKMIFSIGNQVGAVDIDVWDTKNMRKIKVLKHFEHERSDINSNGKVVLSHNSKQIFIFDINNNDTIQKQKRIIKPNSYITYATFDPITSNIISSHHDGYIRLWDINTLECIDSIKAHDSNVECVNICSDGKKIVTASYDKTLKVWDKHTKSLIRILEGHTDGVRQVAFSPDGKYIISTSSDHTARVWNAESGKLFYTYDNCGVTASISPQNDYVMFMETLGKIRIRPLPTLANLIREAKKTISIK